MANIKTNFFPRLYIWSSIKYLLFGFLYFFILCIPVFVVCEVVLNIQKMDVKWMFLIITGMAVAVSLFVMLFSHVRDSEMDKMGIRWTEKKHRAIGAHMQLLPYLIFLGIAALVCYLKRDGILFLANQEFLFCLTFLGFPMLIGVYTFFRWFQLTVFCSKATCKKCHAIFSWTLADSGYSETRDSVDIKVGRETEYVGRVESGDARIDVYQEVPTVQARSRRSTTRSYLCRCAFCGNTKSITEAVVTTGRWKKY